MADHVPNRRKAESSWDDLASVEKEEERLLRIIEAGAEHDAAVTEAKESLTRVQATLVGLRHEADTAEN